MNQELIDKVERLAWEYMSIEEELLAELGKLDDSNGEKNCECIIPSFIIIPVDCDPHFGPEYVLNKYCLKCGRIIKEGE